MKISKEIKDKGKVAFDGPKVKTRQKFAPNTKIQKPKKGKGSKPKKETFEDDNTHNEGFIPDFVEAVITKNYAEAYKYLKLEAEKKLQCRIEAELSTPLF